MFSWEQDLSGFDFSVFYVDFVSDKDHWDIIADSSDILVPFGNILIGNSGADIEHDDSTISTNAKG